MDFLKFYEDFIIGIIPMINFFTNTDKMNFHKKNRQKMLKIPLGAMLFNSVSNKTQMLYINRVN